MFDDFQGFGGQPLQMDNRVQPKQPNAMNPMHHFGDEPMGGAAPVAPPTEIEKFNQWLANQGSGKLNIDPRNPSAAIGQQGQAPVPGAYPVGAKVDGGFPAQGQPPAQPTNTFNRGSGMLPKLPTSPGQAGYMDAHAKAMGTSGDQLRELMGSNPELGTMLARSDAMNSMRQGRQEILDRAAVGDPNAMHGLLTGYNDVGITPNQGAMTLAGMQRGQAASLAEREFGLKKSEHDVAVGRLNSQDSKNFMEEVNKLRAVNPNMPIETAIAQTKDMYGRMGLPVPAGAAGQPQAPAAPGQAPAPGGGSPGVLDQIGAQLRKSGDPSKPYIGGNANNILTNIYTLDQANPGLMQRQGPQIMQMLAQAGLGRDALQGQLSHASLFGGLKNQFAHVGAPTQETAAEDAWRSFLGMGNPESLLSTPFRKLYGMFGN
jgi:hypothetical protein